MRTIPTKGIGRYGHSMFTTQIICMIAFVSELLTKVIVVRQLTYLLVVNGKQGRSGLGKSTLVNTLFKSYISHKSCTRNEKSIESDVYLPTTQIRSVTHVLEEKGVRLCLTITDTPGFGDQINNDDCWVPIQKYINEQYGKYLKEEQCIDRKKKITDTRVHCCLYFIPPTGHWLTSLDVEFMKRLDKMVNVVPVISKADALTLEERSDFKEMIRKSLQDNAINVYPMKEIDEDEEDEAFNNVIREVLPFAVVGSEKQFDVGGKMVYGRKTGWGIIEIENKTHCEFSHLRDMLIRTHMQDLIDVTKLVHYEKYRKQKLIAQQMEQAEKEKAVEAAAAAPSSAHTSVSSKKGGKAAKESRFATSKAQMSFFRKPKPKQSTANVSESAAPAEPETTGSIPSPTTSVSVKSFKEPITDAEEANEDD